MQWWPSGRPLSADLKVGATSDSVAKPQPQVVQSILRKMQTRSGKRVYIQPNKLTFSPKLTKTRCVNFPLREDRGHEFSMENC